MAFGNYESQGMVVSAGMTMYKLRERVLPAPVLSRVVGAEQMASLPPWTEQLDKGSWISGSI